MANRGPTVLRISSPGVCCCLQCCICLNINFLTTKHGLLKLSEAIIGSFCQSLLLRFTISDTTLIEMAYHGLLTTAAACTLTTTILILCYVLSSNTYHLIRQSIFECMFNGIACFFYLSTSSCLSILEKFTHWAMMIAFPAKTVVYLMGVILGIIHGVDAYMGLTHFKAYQYR